jgi:hypothetical protein
MMQSLRVTILVACAVSPAVAQTHTHPACGGEYHYRWAQKVDTLLETATPEPVTVTQILTSWAPPAITKADWCKARTEREQHVYVLTGWVRFVKDEVDDADWHVELTANRTSPRTSCIVVEIPSDDYGSQFAAARDEFLQIVGLPDVTQKGDSLKPAVQVKVTGAALYDGWHRGASAPDGKHGHCNKSLRALWEIHPIYRVERP